MAGRVDGQLLYSISDNSILQEINIETRDVRDIVSVSPQLSDIAFHPDGTLYGVNQHTIYTIDTTSGVATEYASLSATYGWLVGVTIDYLGKFWLSSLGSGRDHLLKYAPGSGDVTDLGSVGYSHWDLEFYNGILYLSGGTNQLDLGYLIQANLNDITTSRIVMNHKAQAYGIASFNDPCQGQLLVAPVTDSLKFLDPVAETFMTGALTDPAYAASAGATSTTSYLGSLPEFSVRLETLGQVPCDGVGTFDLRAVIETTRPGIQYSINGIDFQDSPVFTDLSPGDYNITLRDSLGCTYVTPAESFGAFDPQVSFNVTPAHCNTDNGTIAISFADADSLEFSIDGANWTDLGNFNQLPAGIYQLAIRNGDDCQEQFTLVVDEIPALTHTLMSDPEHCSQEDGRIEVVADGGQGPYEYSLVALPDQPSPVFENLHSGTYSVRTRDALGCAVQNLIDVEFADAPVISDLIIDEAHCGQDDGEAIVLATGSGVLSYIVDGTVFNNNIIPGLSQGAYTLGVIDEFGCRTDSSFAVSSLDGPSISSIETTNDNCFSPAGTIEITASSSSSALTYSIDGVNYTNDASFENVTSGTYSVVVSDAFGCESIEIVNVGLDPVPAIESIESISAMCDLDNGVIEIIPNISEGMEFSVDGITWSTALIHEGLPSGSYDVLMRDVNGCTDQRSISVDRIEPVRIQELISTKASCEGDDGLIEIYADSDAFAEFSLDNSEFTEDPLIGDLVPSEYTVYLRDENNCLDSTRITVGQVDGIKIEDILTHEANCGRKNGGLEIIATNAVDMQIGTEMYPYGEIIDHIHAGLYNVTLMGDHNCRLDTIVEIPEVGCDLFVPNVFTPNGDGTNEILAPQFDPTEVDITSFDIYDRWGNLVFSCPEGCPWDGTMDGEYVPAGVYIYYLRSESKSGVTVNQSGDITVLH